MKFTIPAEAFKNMPKRAWIYVSIGIMALLVLLGATCYKYGGIFIKIERNIEKKPHHGKIHIKDGDFDMEQDIAPGTKVKKTKDGVEILKGGIPNTDNP